MSSSYLLLLSSLELGGAEKQAVNLAKFLQRSKRRVVISGIGRYGVVNKVCEKEELECISLDDLYGFRHRFLIKTISVFNAVFRKRIDAVFFARMFSLKHLIKKKSIQYVISYCTYANNLLGVTRILYSGFSASWYQRDAGIYDVPGKLQQKAIEAMDHVFSNSQSGQDALRRLYGVQSALIRNGVCLSAPVYTCEEWRNRLGISVHEKVATMVANLNYAKDHITVLKAWKIMCKEHARRYHLVLAGRFDDAYQELLDYVMDNELTHFVHFIGQTDDISGLLSATDLAVFGAKAEGSPNGVIEPAIMGLSIVATDVPEIRDVVSQQNYSFLFERNDYVAAATMVERLLEDDGLASRIGLYNRMVAVAKFDPKVNFECLIKEIEC